MRYMSAAMGEVVVEGDSGGMDDVTCPADLEEKLARCASLGHRVTKVQLTWSCYALFIGCFQSISKYAEQELSMRCKHGSAEATWCAACVVESFTDDQLRAECGRRGIGHVSEPVVCAADHHAIVKRYAADRDEWKRRAEAAEVGLADLRAAVMSAGPATAHAVVLAHPKNAEAAVKLAEIERSIKRLGCESMFGGIARTSPPVDNAHYIDPLDLLADDE